MLPGAVHPSGSSASVRCGTVTWCSAGSPSHSWPESSPCFASFSSRYFSASWTVRSTFGCCCRPLYWWCSLSFCFFLPPSSTSSGATTLVSLPAVGHALLCLLLAMLFFACCWLCSCHACCWLCSCHACCWLCSCHACCWLCSCHACCLFMGSVVQVTIVLRHRAVLDNLTLPLPVFFSITGSSGCDSVLSSSDVASCERRVPRAPLCGSLRQCDRQSGTSNATTRSAPLRDRWFAVGTLASLCCSLQQRGPLSLRKFSLSGLGALPRCGLGPPT